MAGDRRGRAAGVLAALLAACGAAAPGRADAPPAPEREAAEVGRAIAGLDAFFGKASSVRARVRLETAGRVHDGGDGGHVRETGWTVYDLEMKRPVLFRETIAGASDRRYVGDTAIQDGETEWSTDSRLGGKWIEGNLAGPIHPFSMVTFNGLYFLKSVFVASGAPEGVRGLLESPRLEGAETIDGEECVLLGFSEEKWKATLALRTRDHAPVRIVLDVVGQERLVSRISAIERDVEIPKGRFAVPEGARIIDVETLGDEAGFGGLVDMIEEKMGQKIEQYLNEGMTAEEASKQAEQDLRGDSGFLEARQGFSDKGFSFGFVVPRKNQTAGEELARDGDAAPDFGALDAVTGKEVRLSDLKGKVVVLCVYSFG